MLTNGARFSEDQLPSRHQNKVLWEQLGAESGPYLGGLNPWKLNSFESLVPNMGPLQDCFSSNKGTNGVEIKLTPISAIGFCVPPQLLLNKLCC